MPGSEISRYVTRYSALLSFFIYISDDKSWQSYATKIMRLLQADPESRVQALSLLDSLVDGLANTPDAAFFAPIFHGLELSSINFITAPLWYRELESQLHYTQKQIFQEEDTLLLLKEYYFRLFPERIAQIPSVFGFHRGTQLPEYIKVATHIHTLTLSQDLKTLKISTINIIHLNILSAA